MSSSESPSGDGMRTTKNGLLFRSAYDWPTRVPELAVFDRPPRAHRIWNSFVLNDIFQFLNLLEISPLTRLSRWHKQFIERDLWTSHVVLGSTRTWHNLYSRCRWFKAWIVRSLPKVHFISVGKDLTSGRMLEESNDILAGIFQCWPEKLRALLWWGDSSSETDIFYFHKCNSRLRTVKWGSLRRTTIDSTATDSRTEICLTAWKTFEWLRTGEIDPETLKTECPLPSTVNFGCKVYAEEYESTYEGLHWIRELAGSRGVRNEEKLDELPEELYSVLRLSLSEYDWDALDHSFHPLHKPNSPEWNHFRHGPPTERTTLYWEFDELNSYWDILMQLWRVCKMYIPDDLKRILCHTSLTSEILPTLPGPLDLMKHSELNEVCPHLKFLPLLPVTREEVQNLEPTGRRFLEINLESLGFSRGELSRAEVVRRHLKWMDNWKGPVRHVIISNSGNSEFSKSVRTFIEKNAGTIEHFRIRSALELDGLLLPHLKSFVAVDEATSPYLSMIRSATNLEHIEMSLSCWQGLCHRYKTEAIARQIGDETTARQIGDEMSDEFAIRNFDVSQDPFEWNGGCHRLLTESWNLTGADDDKYTMIVAMDIQYIVESKAWEYTERIYNNYKIVYTLSQEYRHKLQIISCAVGWWHYPWDCAITEMTTGEVTEETWMDLQLAHGLDADTIRALMGPELEDIDVHPHFGEPTLKINADSRSRTVFGVQGRHVLIEEDKETTSDEIGSLSPKRRYWLEKWYRNLRASIPPNLYILTWEAPSLGVVSPNSHWLTALIKQRRFGEILRWIELDWVPIMNLAELNTEMCA